MPEGDTIYRTAVQLRSVLAGQTICEATSQVGGPDPHSLVGRRVEAIEARGKHLLIHLDDGQAIHSHMGMTGSWHVYRSDQAWLKPARRAHLVLHLPAAVCVCFTPKTLEILTAHGVRRHPYLSRLGPDLLSERFGVQDVVQRLRQRSDLPVGEAVMDQTLVCGIGNVYKSELLFLQRLDPFCRVGDLSDSQLEQLVQSARQLMRRNLQGSRRTTRFGRDGQRLWVYGRSGEKCLQCGSIIRMRRQGGLGRSTYWCPTCQSSQSGRSG
jgi:endonuclease VIII